jgi:SAM-dependent methyltransferase
VYGNEVFMDALKSVESSLTTSEVASKIDCAESTAWRRLTQLANIGAVDRHDDELPLTWEARLYVPWCNVSDLSVSWRNAPRGWGDPLHTIAPYIGGFPPALAHYFIKRFSEPGDVVYDPFAGGGTVPLEALLRNRDGWGSDAFEYATILTRAKCHPMSSQRFEEYLEEVLIQADEIDAPLELLDDDRPRVFFSEYTLKQLLSVRHVLRGDETNEAAYLKAIISGVLHGPSEMFLSLSTRDTFSGSVDYVREYAKEHDLEKPKRDIRKSAMKKQERVSKELVDFPAEASAWVEKADCKNVPFPDDSVDLLLTSPPYMRVLDYSWNNWLRLWWLDADRESEREELTLTESERKYKEFVQDTLSEMQRVLAEDGIAIIVVGDVRKELANRTEYFNTAQMFAEQAANHTHLIPRRILNDEYDLDTRNYAMANQLRYEYSKDVKEEKAMSKLDRCLILTPHQKPLPPMDSIELPWN